ncbi:hypothetical protein, conserved [Plasmodium gonderi]|uniref:Uncharacterized protein n=1 Tax=Plasmodium gonderi TaxID=77519 RepID=A0A1Y1JQL4_PLAGO|nr:hypothetical protein, conserved [Plasmodium gonderi]GAW83818.1 hypothetical protein, conserved [Plasmodium gonderi]
MNEDKEKVVAIHNESKNNEKQRGIRKNAADNNDCHNELQKYKQSFYIIRKTINLIKNHYNNKINKIVNLRQRERKHLSHLKRENIILEDKSTFYAEHVEELKKIYTEQIKLKNNKIQNLQDELDKMRITTENEIESNNTRILKLREDQIERLSQQLDTINILYQKQVDNNRKLIKELEELNRSIMYLNNKIQEEKNNRSCISRRLKYYKRYNKNKKRFKLNFDLMNQEVSGKREREEEGDICVSVLCHLKTELDMIDDENSKNMNKRRNTGECCSNMDSVVDIAVDSNVVNGVDRIVKKKWKKKNRNTYYHNERITMKSNNFFQKVLESNYKKKKKKKSTLFDTIYKKQFFSFYKQVFTENNDIKFENKKMFSSALKNNKKSNGRYNDLHKEIKENIQKREIKKDSRRKDNDMSSNACNANNDHNRIGSKKRSDTNSLTLNNIYFYSNFDDNFDDKRDYVNDGRDYVNDGRDYVNDGRDYVNDGRDYVNDGRDYVNDGRDYVNDGRDYVNDGRDYVNDGRDYVNDGRDYVNDKRDYVNDKRDYVNEKCDYLYQDFSNLTNPMLSINDRRGLPNREQNDDDDNNEGEMSRIISTTHEEPNRLPKGVCANVQNIVCENNIHGETNPLKENIHMEESIKGRGVNLP